MSSPAGVNSVFSKYVTAHAAAFSGDGSVLQPRSCQREEAITSQPLPRHLYLVWAGLVLVAAAASAGALDGALPPPEGPELGLAAEDGGALGALVPELEMSVSMPTTRERVEVGGSDFERYSTMSSNLTVSSEEDVFSAYVMVTSFLDYPFVSHGGTV